MARPKRKLQNQGTPAILAPISTPTFLAWIYARISNDSEKADDSIDNQISLCKQFIHAGNEFTFGGTFTET